MNYADILFTIGITVGAYLFSNKLHNLYPHPLINNVLISSLLVIVILQGTGINYTEYQPGLTIMTFLLGPATVAMAVPLYRHRRLLAQNWLPILAGMIVGSSAHVAVTVLLSRALGLDRLVTVSLAPKAITTPIALETAKILQGNLPLTAAFVIATGIAGAMLIPLLLNAFKISHPLVRGLAYGTNAHGIGTAAAIREGDVQGSASGAAMGLTAVYIFFFAPFLVSWLLTL